MAGRGSPSGQACRLLQGLAAVPRRGRAVLGDQARGARAGRSEGEGSSLASPMATIPRRQKPAWKPQAAAGDLRRPPGGVAESCSSRPARLWAAPPPRGPPAPRRPALRQHAGGFASREFLALGAQTTEALPDLPRAGLLRGHRVLRVLRAAAALALGGKPTPGGRSSVDWGLQHS